MWTCQLNGYRILGAKFVYAVDCIEERLKIAQEFGVTIIHFLKCDIVKKIKELTDGRGADIVLGKKQLNFQRFLLIDLQKEKYLFIYLFLKVVGDPIALELAYNVLRPAGILSSVSVHNSTTFPFSPAE